MARQLRAKHAFLLVPASLHDSIMPMDEICKQEVWVVQWLEILPNQLPRFNTQSGQALYVRFNHLALNMYDMNKRITLMLVLSQFGT